MFDVLEFFNNPDFFLGNSGYREIKRCPICNMTYAEFKSTGKLGCSECYSTFSQPLSEVLRQIHRNPIHTGKIPGNLRVKLSAKKKIAQLKDRLQNAVRNEQYEEAAKLHKEILELEKECKS